MSTSTRERTKHDNLNAAAALVSASSRGEHGVYSHITGTTPVGSLITGLVDLVKLSSEVIATNPGVDLDAFLTAMSDQVAEEHRATLSVELELIQAA